MVERAHTHTHRIGVTRAAIFMHNFVNVIIVDNGPVWLQIDIIVVAFGIQRASWAFLAAPTGETMSSRRSN